jgi:DDE family transposase
VVIDLDTTLVTAFSDKEGAVPTYKRGFGFHPLLAYADHGAQGTGEPLAGLLRPGNAGSNTATDHIDVFDAALEQLPALLREPDEHGRRAVLVRTDAAGATHAFTHHLAAAGVEFSVGAYLHQFDIHPVLAQLPEQAWTPAYQVGNHVPGNTDRSSSPARAPGSPRPPDWLTSRRGRRGPG